MPAVSLSAKPLTTAELAGALFGTWFLWGSTFAANKALAASSPILLLSGFRFAGAGLVLLALFGRRWPDAVDRRALARASLSGVLLYGLGSGGFVLALIHLQSGTVALFSASVPLWVCVAGLLSGTRVRGRTLLGLALGFAGVLSIATADLGTLSSSPALAFALVGALTQAAGVVATRRMALPSSPVVSAVQMLSAAAVFLTASSLAETRAADLPASIFLPFLYLVVPGTIVPVICLNVLIRRSSAFVRGDELRSRESRCRARPPLHRRVARRRLARRAPAHRGRSGPGTPLTPAATPRAALGVAGEGGVRNDPRSRPSARHRSTHAPVRRPGCVWPPTVAAAAGEAEAKTITPAPVPWWTVAQAVPAGPVSTARPWPRIEDDGAVPVGFASGSVPRAGAAVRADVEGDRVAGRVPASMRRFHGGSGRAVRDHALHEATGRDLPVRVVEQGLQVGFHPRVDVRSPRLFPNDKGLRPVHGFDVPPRHTVHDQGRVALPLAGVDGHG